MGAKEKRPPHKDHPPSVHSLSLSEISSSDVSSDNGSSVHERSTPKIAAIIIVGVLIIAILVGVTVYLTDTTRFVIQEIELVQQVGEDLDLLKNGTLGQAQDFLSGSEPDNDEQIYTTLKPKMETLDKSVNDYVNEDSSNTREIVFDQTSDDDDGSNFDKKQPRQRNKSYLDSLDPIKNFRSYPGRPGYTGSTIFYDDQEEDAPGKVFFFHDTEKLTSRSSTTEKSGPLKDNNENLELAGVGIFGGQGIPDGGNRRTSTIDGDYEDLEEANFGARQPGFSRKIEVPKMSDQKLTEDVGSFTYRRGRPDQLTPTKPTPTSTTTKTVENESLEISFDGDLEEDEEEVEEQADLENEEQSAFSHGTRLIPNYVFKSPSFPIREKMGSFDTHLRGGPFGRTAAKEVPESQPPLRPKRPMADSQPLPRPGNYIPNPSSPRTPDGLVFQTNERNQNFPRDKLPPINLSGMPTLDRRPERPPFHHAGPLPRTDQDVVERRGGPYRQSSGPIKPLFDFQNPQRQQIPTPLFQSDDISDTPFNDMRHLVSLAKEEVSVLREIARNITASGKELNLWEVMNAVNITIRENPESPVAGLMRRFYQTYMDHVEESTQAPAPDRGIYEKSLSSLVFLSFGIFLLNSVNDLKAKREGKNFGESPVGRSLKALMSDRPEILELFSGGDERKLGEPAGQSSAINSYLRLLMNLMKVYYRSDSEEVDCVWTAYCHQLNMQAAPGGISSTIARINSVGLKLALRQLPSSDAFISVVRSLLSWDDLPCDTMFPECKTSLEEMQTKNSSEDSD